MPPTVSMNGELGRHMTRAEADVKAANMSQSMGASQDFWIVLASCLCGALVSFLISVLVVEWHTRQQSLQEKSEGPSDQDEPTLADPLPKKPQKQSTFLQHHLFRAKRYGAGFAVHVDLAVRGSTVALFCASTYFFPFLSWWQQQGWEMSYVVLMVAFTFSVDLGSTVRLAWTGFCGTVLPVLNCWLMFSLFPSGVTDGSSTDVLLFAFADFAVFVLMMLGGRFATNTKMFALSWQAHFTMCFINPADDTIFSRGLGDVQLHNAETGSLMGTLCGCLLAILCAIFPATISSLSRCRSTLLHVAWSHGQLLEQLLSFSGAGMHRQTTVAFAAEVRSLHNEVCQMEAALPDTWWECFGCGASGQSAAMMCSLTKFLHVLNDWLEAMVLSTQHSAPHSADRRGAWAASVFALLEPDMLRLVKASEVALRHLACIAASGFLGDAERQKLSMCKDAIDEAHMRLSLQFHEKVAELGSLEGSGAHSADLAVAASLSGYSRELSAHISHVLTTNNPVVGPAYGFVHGLYHLIPKLSELKSVQFHVKIWKLLLTYVACFVIGRLGLMKDSADASSAIIRSFNSTPASTVAYLIFHGDNQAASLKKNLDRFVGVGLGSMMGQLILGISCLSMDMDLRTSPAFLAAYFCFQFMAFFTYFASPTYSYAGLLAGSFFAEHALAACLGLSDRSLTNYQNMLGQLIAIAAASLMDTATDSSASTRATANLERSMTIFTGMLHDLASANVGGSTDNTSFRACVEEGLALLELAHHAGLSARGETRLVGLPWRADLWHGLLQNFSEAWQCLMVLGRAAHGNGQRETFSKSAEIVLALPEFQSELDAICARAEEVFELALGLLRQRLVDDIHKATEALQQRLLTSCKIRVRITSDTLVQVWTRRGGNSEKEESAKDRLGEEFCGVIVILTMLEAWAAQGMYMYMYMYIYMSNVCQHVGIF